MKKNPQTFIDIEYVSINSLIYIFDWNKKKITLNVMFMRGKSFSLIKQSEGNKLLPQILI